MTTEDGATLNAAFDRRRAESRGFWAAQSETLRELRNADEHYRHGNPIEGLRLEVEEACRKRPDLEVEIRREFAWMDYPATLDDL
jgi:hypothetical protein